MHQFYAPGSSPGEALTRVARLRGRLCDAALPVPRSSAPQLPQPRPRQRTLIRLVIGGQDLRLRGWFRGALGDGERKCFELPDVVALCVQKKWRKTIR